jgi:hypothetical protein
VTDATAAMARVRQILASKGRDAARYWSYRGAARFRRELTADGLSVEAVDAFIDEIDHGFAREAVDAALQSLLTRGTADGQPIGEEPTRTDPRDG